MRLIDAEKLWLTTEYTEDGKVHKYYEQFEVDEAPTIDAEPIRHGKWEVHEAFGYVDMTCSVCGGLYEYNYGLEREWISCPHCGARMDSNDSNDSNALNALNALEMNEVNDEVN